MIAAVIVAGAVAVVLAGVLVVVLRMQSGERKEWAQERRALVDRIIARHTGEVIALDRVERNGTGPMTPSERPAAVGI